MYDYDYMDYTIRVLRKCKEYGFKVYMDPHQDIVSVYSTSKVSLSYHENALLCDRLSSRFSPIRSPLGLLISDPTPLNCSTYNHLASPPRFRYNGVFTF
jgi:hypothetical protein